MDMVYLPKGIRIRGGCMEMDVVSKIMHKYRPLTDKDAYQGDAWMWIQNR